MFSATQLKVKGKRAKEELKKILQQHLILV